MPKLTSSNPKYRKHRASGQAILTIDGRAFYLGPFGSKASRDENDRLISIWLAGGRKLTAVGDDMTIVEMVAAFKRFATKHYRRDGKPTETLPEILHATRPLVTLRSRAGSQLRAANAESGSGANGARRAFSKGRQYSHRQDQASIQVGS